LFRDDRYWAVGLPPRQFAVSYAHPDVSFIPIRDLPPSQSVMVRRRRDRSKALRAFLKIARSL
jgi:hypothetical protein